MFKLDALQEKPWYVQLAVFGGVALVVYGAFWYFVTRSTRAETGEVEAKVEKLLRANAGAVVASQRINDFKVTKLKAQNTDVKANQTVTAEFLVTAYYVPPEKLQAPPPEEEKDDK